MVKIRPKPFWLILWVFLFMLSYSLWVTPQDFAKWKILLRYIPVVSVISIAFVVVKLTIFKDFCINSASMKWLLFGALTPPNIVQPCWNFDQRFSPIRQTQCLKNPSTFWILAKKLLKTKISAKIKSLGLSNSVSPRSQKNHSILVKLNKKTFFWPKLNLNCPIVTVPNGY